MKVAFLILGLLAWFGAFITFATGATAVHQIFAAVVGVLGAVLLGSAGIIDAIDKAHTTVALAATKLIGGAAAK